jgi:hypothetical protein
MLPGHCRHRHPYRYGSLGCLIQGDTTSLKKRDEDWLGVILYLAEPTAVSIRAHNVDLSVQMIPGPDTHLGWLRLPRPRNENVGVVVLVRGALHVSLLRGAGIGSDNDLQNELREIQNLTTKHGHERANKLGFSMLKLGIGSTHPTVPLFNDLPGRLKFLALFRLIESIH